MVRAGDQQQTIGVGLDCQRGDDPRGGGDQNCDRALPWMQAHVVGRNALQEGHTVVAGQPDTAMAVLVMQRGAAAGGNVAGGSDFG